MTQRSGIQSVEVGFALLQVLSDSGTALMLRDLAARAGMSAAKAHRYLVSYQRLGLVVQDPLSTRYDLGPAALRLGLATLSRIDAVRMARERMPALLGQIGHTVALAVWGNAGPTLVHWEEAADALTVNLRFGDVMPLLTSATGLCFAAFNTRGTTQQRLDAMIDQELLRLKASKRKDVPTSRTAVKALLAKVRQQGLAQVEQTLLPGIAGVCAPVRDADGHLVLGVVALGSVASFDVQVHGQAVRQVANQLSRDLGGLN